MIDPAVARDFLAQRRLAVVGASDDPKNFGRSVYKALKEHGYSVAAVNPHVTTVEGDACFPDLASVPDSIDGAIVMVPKDLSADIVRECADRNIGRVWLFKGLGGGGSLSDEAVQVCHERGITVVPGACPFMFLEPAGWFHRVHRMARRVNGSLAKG